MGIKIKRRYARLITQIANGDGILMRLFTKIISAGQDTQNANNPTDTILSVPSKLMSNNNAVNPRIIEKCD